MNSKANASGRERVRGYRAVLIAVVLVTVYPVVFVLLTSLKTTSEFYNNIWGLPVVARWGNYYGAWVTARIGEYFKNSVIVVGVSVAVILTLGALAGYALSKFKVRGAFVLIALIMLTQLIPLESLVMPLYLIMSRMKLLNTYITLIPPYIGWGMPMTVLIYKTFFDSIPAELMESARMDGCDELRGFVHVALPMMTPAIATNAIFNFVGLWGELMWASVSTSTSNFGTIPVGVLNFKQAYSTNWGEMTAAISIVLLPLIALFLYTQKYFVRGLSAGAIKG